MYPTYSINLVRAHRRRLESGCLLKSLRGSWAFRQTSQMFYCQLSPVATVQNFLIGAMGNIRHMSTAHALWCLTKLLPKPVGCKAKTSFPSRNKILQFHLCSQSLSVFLLCLLLQLLGTAFGSCFLLLSQQDLKSYATFTL